MRNIRTLRPNDQITASASINGCVKVCWLNNYEETPCWKSKLLARQRKTLPPNKFWVLLTSARITHNICMLECMLDQYMVQIWQMLTSEARHISEQMYTFIILRPSDFNSWSVTKGILFLKPTDVNVASQMVLLSSSPQSGAQNMSSTTLWRKW